MSGRATGNGPATAECPFEGRGFATAYALDALDGDDRRAFEAHLAAGCPVCTAEIAASRVLAAQLPLGLEEAEEVEPSPGLRARILDAIAAESAAGADGPQPRGAEPGPRLAAPPVPDTAPMPRLLRWRAPQAYAAAAVFLLAVGLGLLGWNLDLQRQVREVKNWQLASTTGQAARGEVLYLPQYRQAILIVEDLPPLQPGQVYQVWLIPEGGRPEGAGVLTTPSGETAMRADMSRYRVIAITIEPGPLGSAGPTTPPFIMGTIEQ